jgi:hypothetical protein
MIPTPDDLLLLAQIAEKRAADRLQRILSSDRINRLDGIAEDVGLALLSQELAVMPPPGTDLRQLVLAKYDLEPKFAAALKAWVMLIEQYLDAERERCVREVKEFYNPEKHVGLMEVVGRILEVRR